jgi:hypothetical protein
VDPYKPLAAVLSRDGIRCYFQMGGQMVVSTQVGLVRPDRGNSFWVTRAANQWHLFTWAPVGYRVPEGADIAGLCRVFVACGSSALPRVPVHIAREFGLTELSDDEAEAVYAEMDKRMKPGGAEDGEGRNGNGP